MKLFDAMTNEERAGRLIATQKLRNVVPRVDNLAFIMRDFELKPSWLNEMEATQWASLICSGDYEHDPDRDDDRPY